MEFDNNLNGFGSKPDGERGLLYWDGTGTVDSFKSLIPGSYSLSFSIDTSEEEASREKQKLGGLSVWFGDVQTNEVSFEIIELNE